jgi:ADP-ribosylglycohydrolase
MLGAIIGDIVGSRWEFNPTNDYNFELFSEKNGFTDDTICTIAVADALLHSSDDYGKYIHEWCRRYPHPMGGYGGRFAKWVQSDDPQPYGSFGNGSAMRVSPIGMWFYDEDKIYPEAEKTVACSHNHLEAIKSAQSIAWTVYCAVKTFDGVMTQQEMEHEILDITTCILVDGEYDDDINYEDYRNKFDETCQGTVPVAIDIIFKSNSFEDAIRRAVSLGGDADTLGAIVGSIAEHIWGIPNYMIDSAMSYLPAEMQKVVKEFYAKCESRETYKPRHAEKKERQKEEIKTIMQWKLMLGNINRAINGKSLLPDKSKVATSADWKAEQISGNKAAGTCARKASLEDSKK